MTHVPVKLCRFKSNRAHKYLEKVFYEMSQPLDPIPLWLEPFVVMFTENEIELKNRFQTLSTATLDHVIVNHCYNGFELVKKSSFEFLYERIDGSEALDNTESLDPVTRDSEELSSAINRPSLDNTTLVNGEWTVTDAYETANRKPSLDSDSLDTTTRQLERTIESLDTTAVAAAEDSQVAPIPFPPAIDKGYPAGADLSSDSRPTKDGKEWVTGQMEIDANPPKIFIDGLDHEELEKYISTGPLVAIPKSSDSRVIITEVSSGRVGPVRIAGKGPNQQSMHKGSPDAWGGGLSLYSPELIHKIREDSIESARKTLVENGYLAITQKRYAERIQEAYSQGFNKALDYARSSIMELKIDETEINTDSESRSDDTGRSGE